MEKTTINIPKISCGHCVMAIKNELEQLDGVSLVEGSPENKTITVNWESPADIEKIKDTLDEINYPAL